MIFWDSSAVIPLCLEEPASEMMRHLHRAHGIPVVWWGTLVECHSALARQLRRGKLVVGQHREAQQTLVELAAIWHEVLPAPPLRERALRLLGVHPLRTADALQLAAALVWAGERPVGRTVVCLDNRLREAALSEGFTVLPAAGTF